jgi:hypothetical protein
MNLEDLRHTLRQHPISDFINLFVLNGDSFCFSNDSNIILALKRQIADHFNIHVKNIEIVGSAKLGISLSDTRHGEPFDEKSDIDIAIISSELFDYAWQELLKLDLIYYKLRQREKDMLSECQKTIHRGFISPDRFPLKSDFSKNWWHIFSSLSALEQYENRKVRGRLFKNWLFAEKYYSIRLVKMTKGGHD